MLISEDYRQLNAEMHRLDPTFGMEGHKYARTVYKIAREIHTADVLDFGAGKASLAEALSLTDLNIRSYDPAIPEISTPPLPADLVVCTDVLEHIEPDCLSDVLDDLKRLTRKNLYLVIAMRPAGKLLPDGTNPHKIIQPCTWWHETLDKARIDILWMRMLVSNRKKYEFTARVI